MCEGLICLGHEFSLIEAIQMIQLDHRVLVNKHLPFFYLSSCECAEVVQWQPPVQCVCICGMT